MTEIQFDGESIWAEDAETLERLNKNYFGESRKGKIFLDPEEALYLISLQNTVCKKGDGVAGFNELSSFFLKSDPRLILLYNAFRDWRDRGLIVRRKSRTSGKGRLKGLKSYPMKPLKMDKLKASSAWYPHDMFSVIEDEGVGKQLFQENWIGQYGVYKQDRGKLLKLDFFESVFLSKHFGLKVEFEGITLKWRDILKQATKQREFAKALYDVYEEWRLRGYVVKTGFKFGTHFRIYFPGGSPTKEKYIHSKHVLHVFPREQKLLVSEWARAVRVAHGVKKTFLLGMPRLRKKDIVSYPADFIAWRRKKENNLLVRETPEDRPRYLLVAVGEDEHIGGIELASLLLEANERGLELLLSITDRETAITYYVLKKVTLPGSRYEYYEIEWMKP